MSAEPSKDLLKTKVPIALEWIFEKGRSPNECSTRRYHVPGFPQLEYWCYCTYPRAWNDATRTWIKMEEDPEKVEIYLHCREIDDVNLHIDVKAECSITVNDGEPKPFSDDFYFENHTAFAIECTVKEWEDSFDANGIKTIRVNGTFTFAEPFLRGYRRNVDVVGDSDFIIVAEDEELKVHKSVLIASSTIFATMFESEYQWKEKEENKYEIQDFCVEIVERALDICYGDYCNPESDETPEDLVLLYKFADKYDINELKNAVIQYLTLMPHNLVEYSNLCFENDVEELLEKCYDYFIVCKADCLPIKDLELLNDEVKNKFFMKMFSNALVEKIPEPSDHKTYQKWTDFQVYE
uniref:BTB domain-containing protein n=1 Tax=Panagrolaimus sp. ES5 TaxID=591445 RepID=A0AC34F4C2_9BILA